MIEGKLIHCLFLNPDDFDKEFVLMATNVPSANPKEVLERLYNHYSELKAMGDPRCLLEHFEHAILYGEKAYKQNPVYLKNIINLIDSYRLCNDLEKAKYYFEIAKNLEPLDEKVIKMKNIIFRNDV